MLIAHCARVCAFETAHHDTNLITHDTIHHSTPSAHTLKGTWRWWWGFSSISHSQGHSAAGIRPSSSSTSAASSGRDLLFHFKRESISFSHRRIFCHQIIKLTCFDVAAASKSTGAIISLEYFADYCCCSTLNYNLKHRLKETLLGGLTEESEISSDREIGFFVRAAVWHETATCCPSHFSHWKRRRTSCASDWPRPTRHPVRQSLASKRRLRLTRYVRRCSSSCRLVSFITVTWLTRFTLRAVTIELTSIGEWLVASFPAQRSRTRQNFIRPCKCHSFCVFIISICELWTGRGFSDSFNDIKSLAGEWGAAGPFSRWSILVRPKMKPRERLGDLIVLSLKYPTTLTWCQRRRRCHFRLWLVVRTRVEQQNWRPSSQ